MPDFQENRAGIVAVRPVIILFTINTIYEQNPYA